MTSLPNDPEALADALIACLAALPNRPKLMLPTQPPASLSETELENYPCAVLQFGAATYAGLPLDSAAPDLALRFSALNVADSIPNLGEFVIGGLRSVPVPWLGGSLALLPHRQGGIEVPFFVNDRHMTLCGRTNEWIYALMDDMPPPQLDDAVVAYARFFFATVIGQLGAFRLADSVDDAVWLQSADESQKSEFVSHLQPLHKVGVSGDGRLELRGTVIFKNALFSTSIMIAPNWQLELTNEDLLMEELAIAFGPATDLLVRR